MEESENKGNANKQWMESRRVCMNNPEEARRARARTAGLTRPPVRDKKKKRPECGIYNSWAKVVRGERGRVG